MLLAMMIAPLPSRAQVPEALSIDLAEEKTIDITTGFDGARLVVYGTRTDPGDIVVTVRGPTETMVVRRKESLLGIWMNRTSVRLDGVPSYYDLALTRPENDIASADTRHRQDIGLDALHFETLDNVDAAVTDTFREALIRNRQSQGLFPLEPKSIFFINDNFFRVPFYLPSNVPTGIYKVKALLIRDGTVLATQERTVKVAQKGFSARVYIFAQTQPFAYGVLAVMIALFFGWGAYIVLRRE